MNEELTEALQGLQQRDLETRERLLQNGRLFGSYDEEMQRVHRENAEALDRMVSLQGWPDLSKAGTEGCLAAWLVAQHAICTPALQRRFLRELEAAVESGEAPAKLAAYLSDRIRFNEGRPQVYGTVLDWNEQGELGCELEDTGRVDGWRASVGLPPFEESLRAQCKQVAAEGAGRRPISRLIVMRRTGGRNRWGGAEHGPVAKHRPAAKGRWVLTRATLTRCGPNARCRLHSVGVGSPSRRLSIPEICL